jgi:hypothetical protein
VRQSPGWLSAQLRVRDRGLHFAWLAVRPAGRSQSHFVIPADAEARTLPPIWSAAILSDDERIPADSIIEVAVALLEQQAEMAKVIESATADGE